MPQMELFSTNSMYNDVQDFHEAVLNIKACKPHLLDQARMTTRVNFMLEELDEFTDATIHNDLVAAADAIADIVYVALGTAHLMGLPFNMIWDAVQKANMSKVPGMTKRGIGNDAAKPEGWVGPEAAIQLAIEEENSTWA